MGRHCHAFRSTGADNLCWWAVLRKLRFSTTISKDLSQLQNTKKWHRWKKCNRAAKLQTHRTSFQLAILGNSAADVKYGGKKTLLQVKSHSLTPATTLSVCLTAGQQGQGTGRQTQLLGRDGTEGVRSDWDVTPAQPYHLSMVGISRSGWSHIG